MEVLQIPIGDLKPNEKNPRRITKREMQKLMRSITEFGFQEPVVVNNYPGRENIIIGGHQRVKAAEQLKGKLSDRLAEITKAIEGSKDAKVTAHLKILLQGMMRLHEGRVPIMYVGLPKDKEETFNISLNKISGDWDEEKLAIMLKELLEKDADISLTGFAEPEVDKLMDRYEKAKKKQEEIDKAPPVPVNPKTKPGEIWKLGDHTLMCGDSTKAEDFKKLMGTTKADLCWTDPPYGVSYKGTNNPNGKPWGVMTNDELRGDELYSFLEAAYKNIFEHTKEGAGLYTCYASINHQVFEVALNTAGFTVKQQLIWEKGHVLGHSDYHWTHEPILYCRKKDQPSWFGDRTHKTVILNATIENLQELKKEELINMISEIRKNSDLIREKKDPSNEYLHSTQKPVALSQRLIKNSSRPKELVLEPCGGSGSTLMACETSGRKCYTMEISEKYVDVIITRWQDFTEKKAIRESDGVEFNNIK